jgi:hypothetical protein
VVDESCIGEQSLFDEYRVRRASMTSDRYPFTVRLTCRFSVDGYFALPSWKAQAGRVPVQMTVYEIRRPPAIVLRHETKGEGLRSEEFNVDGMAVMRWSVSELPARADVAPDTVFLEAPEVRVAPVAFVFDGRPGRMSSWRELGAWNWSLWQGRMDLPADARAEVEAAVSGAASARERVDRLYRFLQDRVRYISVQLGIGGWQPFDAEYVHERRYGDCKALSAYMVALLDAAGVKAFPALVHAGTEQFATTDSFPCMAFNHTIVGALADHDTVWLECTSDSSPPGHLGRATEGKKALALTPAGGVLLQLPSSPAEANVSVVTGRLALHDDGMVRGSLLLRAAGAESDPIRVLVRGGEAEAWARDVILGGGRGGGEVRLTSPLGRRERDVEVSLRANVTLPAFAARSGARLFLPAGIRGVSGARLKGDKFGNPAAPFRHSFILVDSVEITHSGTRRVEAGAGAAEVRASFGSYRRSVIILNDTTLALYRRLEIRALQVPSGSKEEFGTFRRAVLRTDASPVVLR